jgi:hypothetical protein
MIFYLDSLTESGAKRAGYERPKPASGPSGSDGELPRGCLYDYFLYENAYIPMLGSVDPGYEWAKTDSQTLKLANWPTTVFIQGDEDFDVDADVTVEAARSLGPEKARLIMAKGQPHLFEARCFLEDGGVEMDAIRCAVKELDEAISQVHKR